MSFPRSTSTSHDDLPRASQAAPDSAAARGKHDDPKIDGEVNVQEGVIIEDGLRRALLGRHVSLISLASVIGATCFYGFGAALNYSGPLGALIGFSVVGVSSPSSSSVPGKWCLLRPLL